ncbi:MAG: restriction endonuclease subunit S [Betaproteobacteria bacterium]|nr:restriction endonuclease subunit S [Betaproteobacteria bacterium]
MSLPRYPEYKDSGVEWLGEVPAHWRTASLKWLSKRYSGGTPDKNNLDYWTDGTIPWLNSGAVNQSRITEPSAYITSSAFEASSAKWIPSGALVMALAGQGKTKGMVAEVLFETTCNQSMAVIVPQAKAATRYLFWWLTSNYQNIRNMAGGDLRDGLNLELLGSIPCPIPESFEQTAIATFLDNETAKIDALVAEQEKLLTLLAEKRQATISHAVTKGLNRDAPMKDSGVEWLGVVPAHWEVKQLRHVARVVRGASPRPAGDPRFFAEDNVDFENMPWVTVAEITKNAAVYLTNVNEYLTPLGVANSQVFESGTLVFTNSGATLGVPKILAIDCCANDGVLAFKSLSPKVESRFVYDYLLTTTERLRTEMKQGGGQPNLNTEIVKNIGIALPPLAEQAKIVKFLDQEAARLDALTTEASRAINLLRERRSALISAAVTGKIDVRPLAEQKVA